MTHWTRAGGTYTDDTREIVVVVGNGMVGLRCCEKLVELDTMRQYKVVTFCEEKRSAYHRMNMTQYFETRDKAALSLASEDWYQENDIDLLVGDAVVSIDRARKVVISRSGKELRYDKVVLATGSVPFYPPVPGIQFDTAYAGCSGENQGPAGVFGYRSLEDLDNIIEYSQKNKKVAVMGGGLLGLEAAKAAHDLGCEVHVIEMADWLMCRQINQEASDILVSKIEDLGIKVHLGAVTQEVMSEDGVMTGLRFKDGSELDVGMLIVSTGISPRDELARTAGLELGPRGGVAVDSQCRTSDADIFSVGEACVHKHSKYGSFVYGLVAPGYEMAEVVAQNLAGSDAGEPRTFGEADLSTKLKLLGCDVASFGEPFPQEEDSISLEMNDPFSRLYKKLHFSPDGKKLIGGILVGDASDYQLLAGLCKAGDDLPKDPKEYIYPSAGDSGTDDVLSLPASFQVCSCNDVSKGAITDFMAAASDADCTVGNIKACTGAGTGCGGCMPMVGDLFAAEMKAQGRTMKKDLCEHFAYSRQELFDLVRLGDITTFEEMIRVWGKGDGCEICKPAMASIFASINSEFILEDEHLHTLDTNDRFLANIQRGGTYSVVPRVPGGEITPAKLKVIAEVAEEYGLYTKITGGQRIDLFGAHKQDLPDIWRALVEAGFESGHAYGKALRTVKSCVGSEWCRFGQQQSVSFAIQVEERYKGIRAPHKIKSAVSGCIRECAEAQSKDFAYIATEEGYNFYIGGNGGAKPRHADLFLTGATAEECIAMTDRFLMFYIRTAKPLERTAWWMDRIEGGVDYLREVLIEDSLGICAELEADMQSLVDKYKCEWAEVVNNPEAQKRFRQFTNTEEKEYGIDFVDVRGMRRPADWFAGSGESLKVDDVEMKWSGLEWQKVGVVADFPPNSGATVKWGDVQIAVFNFAMKGEWYATHNMCPHKKAFVLDQGLLGSAGEDGEVPKVVCPLHKKQFDLRNGECISGDDMELPTFEVKVENGEVFLMLPEVGALDRFLSTKNNIVTADGLHSCSGGCASC
eukprot:gene7204-8586_t